jgi:hypothetical protein
MPVPSLHSAWGTQRCKWAGASKATAHKTHRRAISTVSYAPLMALLQVLTRPNTKTAVGAAAALHSAKALDLTVKFATWDNGFAPCIRVAPNRTLHSAGKPAVAVIY